MKTTTVLLILLSAFITGLAQAPTSDRQQFIRVESPVIALTHVRVIDKLASICNKYGCYSRRTSDSYLEQATEGIAIPDLAEIWTFLQGYETIADATKPLDRRESVE